MSKWEKLAFDVVFADETKYGHKIPKEAYKTEGRYPIVDQGQEYIAGYSDDATGLFVNVPAIIFGDHTRALKYIDFPFYLGADGVKVLRSKISDVNYKFLYYFLTTAHIPNTGYNRHYKWLKEVEIPLPPLHVQQKIVDILDRANALIEKRKAQIEKLDLLVKSQFIEMFGDPVTNPKGWEVEKWDSLFNTTTGKLDSNAMVENGKYPFFTCAKESYLIDEYAFDCEALLLAGNNAAGIYDVKHYSGKFNAYQRTYVITLKNSEFSYLPFKLMLEQKLDEMKNLSKGTNTRYLTMGILNDFDFLVPPLSLQKQFADFVKRVEAYKAKLNKSLEMLELNYKSLMQKCFEGHID